MSSRPSHRSSSEVRLNAMENLEKRSNVESYSTNDPRMDFYETSYGYSEEDGPTSAEERALVRKLDLLIMPIICILDFLQFLDKSTINYAAVFTFKQDLNLQGSQYSLLGSIFYLGYLAYQLPNNYFLQHVPVGRYIGIIVILWGVVLACTSLGQNFSQLAAMRFLLGLFEAGIYPAMTLLVSTCYRRKEQAARLGAFWIWNGLALIIGGLISYGIGMMDETVGGLVRWRWLMIILGSVTIVMGIFTFFFLIDNPKSKALNLNAEQEILVEDRTRDNAVVRTTTVNKGQIKEALFELRFWCFCFACLLINLQNGAMTIYNAQLIQDFGFTSLQTVLLSVGSGGADILFILIAVWLVRKTNETLMTAAFLMVIDIIGLILLLVIPVPKAKLVGFYLAWSYCAAYVLLVTSISNNVSGYTKKIFYNGVLMIFYTVGNFVGSLFMVAPPYTGGMIGYICANAIVIVLFFIARWKMLQVNRLRLAQPPDGVTNVEDDLSDVQDRNFIYRL